LVSCDCLEPLHMNLFMQVSSLTVDKRITWYFMMYLVTTPTSYCFVEWDQSIINYPKNKFWYNTQINSFQAYCSDLMSAELNWHLGCKFSGDVLICSFVQCASASSDNAVVESRRQRVLVACCILYSEVITLSLWIWLLRPYFWNPVNIEDLLLFLYVSDITQHLLLSLHDTWTIFLEETKEHTEFTMHITDPSRLPLV
jgi:hypothetical protein